MHGSIIDMIFSSIKIMPSVESPKWGKIFLPLLNMGKIKRVEQIHLLTIASPISESQARSI